MKFARTTHKPFANGRDRSVPFLNIHVPTTHATSPNAPISDFLDFPCLYTHDRKGVRVENLKSEMIYDELMIIASMHTWKARALFIHPKSETQTRNLQNKQLEYLTVVIRYSCDVLTFLIDSSVHWIVHVAHSFGACRGQWCGSRWSNPSKLKLVSRPLYMPVLRNIFICNV